MNYMAFLKINFKETGSCNTTVVYIAVVYIIVVCNIALCLLDTKVFKIFFFSKKKKKK